ncbi:hypothetical protein YC2023_033122 [Brassica napus]
MAILELVRGRFGYMSIAFRQSNGAAPYDSYLRTLVEEIKPFIVRLGVKKEDYELSSRNLTLCELLYLRSVLRVFHSVVFDTMPRDVRDQCTGFRARPRFTPGFRKCDDYFDLRISFLFHPDSIPI